MEIEIRTVELPKSLSHDMTQKLQHDMPGSEIERFRSIGTPARARSFLIGRSILRRLVSKRLGIRPEEVPIETTSLGKPYVPSLPVRFSLGYCRTHLLIVISDEVAVGADIEIVRPVSTAVRARALTAAEQDLLADLDEENGSWGFTRLWTIKEACLKALGIPLVGQWKKVQGTMEARGSWDGITWTQLDVAKDVTGSVALISTGRGSNSEEAIAAPFSL